ncbi:hypothetical protein GCM10022419_116600 [Nonomuraea rosea]|uniref:Uncharacterized protein n=1 Tax=Nonomuraea rosea TaxID=638574 RepID=A0ABP6ZL15_9ACTN
MTISAIVSINSKGELGGPWRRPVHVQDPPPRHVLITHIYMEVMTATAAVKFGPAASLLQAGLPADPPRAEDFAFAGSRSDRYGTNDRRVPAAPSNGSAMRRRSFAIRLWVDRNVTGH